jgi:membrane protein implicated in regulation of membrane protease activity
VFMLRLLGLVAPPKSSGGLARAGGILIAVTLVVAILLLCFGIANLVALPFGGISLDLGIFYGFVLLLVAIAVLAVVGRRRQRRAQAEQAERVAAARSR